MVAEALGLLIAANHRLLYVESAIRYAEATIGLDLISLPIPQGIPAQWTPDLERGGGV